MTRQVTIVNTSNWDGEDWIVSLHQKGTGNVERTTLKPGEQTDFNPEYEEVSFEATESKTPEPVSLTGKGQVFPQVLAYFDKD